MTLKLPPKIHNFSAPPLSQCQQCVGDQQRAVQHNRSVSCLSLFESLDQVSFSKQTRLQLQSCNSVPIPKDSSVTNPRWHQVTHRTATSHCFSNSNFTWCPVFKPDFSFLYNHQCEILWHWGSISWVRTLNKRQKNFDLMYWSHFWKPFSHFQPRLKMKK